MKIVLKFATVLAAVTLSGVLSGCGLGTQASQAFSPSAQGNELKGRGHGGQQPIAGATVQLYMVGTTGYGSAALPLNALDIHGNPVTTDGNGMFTIASHDTVDCLPGNQTYIVMTGGDPGIGSGVNSAISLLATLGTCSDLASWSTFINMNEVTTVASVWALSPFMVDTAHVGTSSTNTAGLATAYATVRNLVDLSTGQVSGPTLPAGAVLPSGKIISLANILGSCLNSSGPGSPACGTLFANAGTTPNAAADTAAAAALIAQNPGSNVGSLFSLVTPSVAFTGGLSAAPNDYTLAIQYARGLTGSPKGVTVDAAGDLWVPNGTTVTELSSTGAIISPSPYAGFTTPVAVAIDASGTAWVADKGANALGKIASGSVTFYTGTTTGDLNAPSGVVVDNAGNLWLNNSGNNTIAAFSPSGTELAGSPFSASGVTGAVGIAVTPH